MIHQRTKDFIFTLTQIISYFLYPYYKLKYSKASGLKVQLGSSSNILNGWINIDGNPTIRKSVYYDIRNKLPFPDNSVDIIFASNVLEHFYPDELEKILLEIFRVTGKYSIIRIIVPSLEKSVNAYINNDSKFFGDYPRSYSSIGGRFVNLIFTDAQHKIAFDYEFISELLLNAGFKLNQISISAYGESKIPEKIYSTIMPFEEHFKDSCLFVEISKNID